tara:strand:+ start:1941 stop:2246 length:306 start_codon:yes stop_codon:yes gene_type:complete
LTPAALWQEGNLLLSCHLQPGASRSEWSGAHGDAIKIRIKAPPVDGKANAELIRFLAAEFSVSKRAVSILSGELNRRKRVSIEQPTVLPSALNGLIPLRPV